MSENRETKIVVMGDDEKRLEVPRDAAMRSKLIKGYINSGDPSIEVLFPVPECNIHILTKIFEYCEKIISVDPAKIKDFKKQYVKGVDNSTVKDLVGAANYLKIKDLVELLGGEAATSDGEQDMPIGRLKDLSDLQENWPPGESEQALRQIFPWCFERSGRRRR